MNSEKPLVTLIKKIKERGIDIKRDYFKIKVNINLTESNFSRIKPLLYLLLSKFEKSYFIVIEGLPLCLMPDASSHIIYIKRENMAYLKKKPCQQCKYKDSCPGWPKDLKTNEKMIPSPVRDLPREIVLEVTQSCNLDCRLCFIPKKIRELPLFKVKKVIDDCDRLKIKTIRFSGGEPLLYKNLESALDYAKDKNLYVILNTNATTLDKKIKKILKKNIDNILVSLQGFNSYSENKMTRSRVNFKEKIKNIMELNYLLPVLRVGTIISQTLIKNLPKYYYLINKLGIKNWDLFRPMADNKDAEFNINRNDFLKIMNYIQIIKKYGLDIKIANPVPFCITSDFELSSYVLLGAENDDGHSRLIFDAAGFFKPSYLIYKNLGSEIEMAWQNPFLRKMRSLYYLPEKCKSCFYLKWCKGGSRYWAKITNGEYFSPDPLMRDD